MNEQALNSPDHASFEFPKQDRETKNVVDLEESLEERRELKTWTDKIVEDALDDLQIEFNFNFHEQNFTFHGREHSQDVIDRSSVILRTMQSEGGHVSEKDITLAKIAAAYHDAKQAWEVNDQWEEGSDDAKFGKKLRKRKTSNNEIDSAQKAMEAMRYVNQGAGKEIFSQIDMERVADAIEGTIPGFDPELGTVIQPSAESSQDIITRAIALADLGEAGMSGPEAFLDGGDNLFMEENVDMWDLDPSTLSDDQKAYYKKRMDGWNGFQPIFANGRKEKFSDETATLPEKSRAHLEKLFNQFDASIKAAEQRAKIRKEMDFDELYTSISFMKYREENKANAA